MLGSVAAAVVRGAPCSVLVVRARLVGVSILTAARPIWIISAEHWPRAYLRAELIERGYDATGFDDLRAAVASLVLAPSRRPALIVLDVFQNIPGERLLATLFRVGAPVVAVGGAAESVDPDLRRRGWAAFLVRPLTIGAIADAVDRALAGAATSPPGP